MNVRTLVIPVVLVLAAAAVAIGAYTMRSSERDALREVASREAERAVQAPLPISSRPIRPEAKTEIERPPETTAAPEARPERQGERRGEGSDEERRRRFRQMRRPSLGDSPMSPEDWAQRWTDRQSRRQEWMDRFDIDGDGKISDEERDAMREEMRARRDEFMLRRMTSRFDADGDGELNEAERIEAEAELAVQQAERQARMIERFDTDGDGRLSDAESQAARESFGRGRGPGGGGDRARGGRTDWRKAVERYDADGDGELNLDESYDAYLDQFSAREQKLFVRQYDESGDGAVDSGDLEAFLMLYRGDDPKADINGDGTLNQQDVERFRDLMIVSP